MMRLPGGRPPAAVVACCALATSLAFRLPTLAMLPPWGDEVLTLRSLDLPFWQLAAERLSQMHAPTYFWLLQALGLDAGSLFLLRLPSALADSLGAGLTALVACRLGGWRAGLVLAFVYAATPALLEEAQDARPYGLFFGFLALLLCSAGRLVDHPRLAALAWRPGAPLAARALRWTWAAAALAAVALASLLPLGLFALVAVDAAVLWRVRRRRRLVAPWLLHRLASLLLLAPLLYAYATHVGRYAGNYWYDSGPRRLLRVLRVVDGAGVSWDPDRFLGDTGNRVLLVLFLLLVLLGLLWARRRASLALAIALAFGTQALLVAVSQHTSLYAARYFAIAAPALSLFAALGLAGLWQRWPRPALPLGLVFAVLLFLQSLDAMHQLGKPRLDLAVERLRAAGIERLGIHSAREPMIASVLYTLDGKVEGIELSPWQVLLAARQGLVVWLLHLRPIDPLWPRLAERAGLLSCAPAVRPLYILAIAARAEDLRASCPPR
jgi:4-amino-4-deoxy-L-arabinose transferase-like glycosyltransferase